ncbi:hypothetical protein FGO68_gene5415 [Halteria grandinella]|uniref:Uncharacterized protein n=1 Tax=Halteria grandinella TaxID=5974 RepID=A0A8J8SVE7_HALGN|nr:hypothetical protein FGO68_gene5415 [Halteria grandinella]
MVSTTQSTEVEGFTYTSSWAHSAHELMLLNILFDFDRQMEETKKEGSVILNERAIRVGFSYAGHPKFGNLFQSAFVMQKSNQIM